MWIGWRGSVEKEYSLEKAKALEVVNDIMGFMIFSVWLNISREG